MYERFLETVLAYVRALNAAGEKTDESDGQTPYLDRVPVLLEDGLCGFLVDEIGGEYSYVPATAAELAWWDSRPWAARRD